MQRKWILLIALAVLLLFAGVAWVAGRLLGLERPESWLLWGGFLLLGLLAAILSYLYLAAAAKAKPASASPVDDEVEIALATADSRLAASRAGRIARLPVVLCVGPTGAAKTTVVSRSGIQPELLAGEVQRGETVAPTSGANVWFGHGAVFVEAGGKVLDDANRWARLVRRLRPRRLAAVFGRGRQAPRVALVCFGCDELLKPGAGEAVPAAARKVREALLEATRRLGIRLPVYVLFTKADKLPYFTDFVRNLSRDEAREVLGATLPAPAPEAAGVYAERESRRLGDAFQALLRAMSLRRPEILAREGSEDIRAGAYEFPRELRKLSDRVVEFLLELGRPSHLGTSPFIRGFYFTGVRPILVQDTAVAPATDPSAGVPVSATTAFDPRALMAGRRAEAPGGTTRKVPDWVFLPRLLPDVVLADRAALGVTGGGAGVNVLRRLALGSAVAAAALFTFAMTVSYSANRGLEGSALAAAQGVTAVEPGPGGAVPVDALQRLDALRAEAERLRGHQVDGRPLRLRWGLYSGQRILPDLRRLYFDRFERLLWASTRARLAGALLALPESPTETSEYGAVYDALKAYLITTSHPEESSAEFLAPVLLAHSVAADDGDEELRELAERQFAFFAAELPHGHPYPQAADAALVADTRAFLGQFQQAERAYQALVGELSERLPPVDFEAVAGPRGGVRNTHVVPGAFTREGWAAAEQMLANLDEIFHREDWVLGPRAAALENTGELAAELRTRYVADYVGHWRSFLDGATVDRAPDLRSAAAALSTLADNSSPLLHMLALASRHTGVDTAFVGPVFQPVHLVVEPDVEDRFIGEGNAGYMLALSSFQSSVEQAAGMAGPARSQALAQAAMAGDQVRSEVRQLAQQFRITGEARAVGSAVERLLAAPVAGVENVVGRLPAAEVNQAGTAFCRAFSPVLSVFPFNPGATAEATMEQVAAAFQPGSGMLWGFYDEVLAELLVARGTDYVARPGASPMPTPAFVAFFDRAAAISRALYSGAGAGPAVTFILRPATPPELEEVTVVVDGLRQTFTPTMRPGGNFIWEGARAREARILGRLAGAEVTLVDAPPGPWALFRLLQRAELQTIGPGSYTLRWSVPQYQLTLTADLNIAAGVPVFSRTFIGGLSCVSQVAG